MQCTQFNPITYRKSYLLPLLLYVVKRVIFYSNVIKSKGFMIDCRMQCEFAAVIATFSPDYSSAFDAWPLPVYCRVQKWRTHKAHLISVPEILKVDDCFYKIDLKVNDSHVNIRNLSMSLGR